MILVRVFWLDPDPYLEKIRIQSEYPASKLKKKNIYND